MYCSGDGQTIARYTFISFFLLTELPAQHFNCIVLLHVSIDTLCAPHKLFIRTWVENLIARLSVVNLDAGERDFLRAQARISNVTRKGKHYLYSLSSAAREEYSIVHGSEIALL